MTDATTQLPAPKDPNTLYILDVSGYVFRAYHALPPLSNSKGEPTQAVTGFTQMLLKFMEELQPAHLALAMDSKGPSFRKAMFDGYKAHRQTPPDMRQQMTRCREVLDAMGLSVYEQQGVEADDLIATLTVKARAAGMNVVVVSADKDLLQLVGEGVIQLDTMRNKVFGVAEAEAKMGVPPHQVRDLLALMGDSSDNVPGVPKVGAKTAASLLAEYGDIDNIYANLESVTRKALKATLTENRDKAYLSRDLVSLKDDVELDFSPDKLSPAVSDWGPLRALLTELEMTRVVARLPGGAGQGGGSHADGAQGGGSSASGASAASTLAWPSPTVVTDTDGLTLVRDTLTKASALSVFSALDDNDAMDGELVGLGLSDGTSTFYVPLAHRYLGAPEQLEASAVIEALRPLLEGEEGPALHLADAKRERKSFRRLNLELRATSFDAMLASYLLESNRHAHLIEDVARQDLHHELPTYDAVTEKQRGSQLALSASQVEAAATYAAHRAHAAQLAAAQFGPRLASSGLETLMKDVELPLSTVLADMECTGICVDVDLLTRMSEEASGKLRELEQKCHTLAGHEFNVASPRQLEKILFDELGLPVIQKTKTARSTNQQVLEELAPMHELPEAILEHRALAKLQSTYLEALPKVVRKATGRIHTDYQQAVAATGRLSSTDPNLQNIPIRTEFGRRIRDAFVPREGYRILAADYSQIELRVLAHLSQDAELCDAYIHDKDVHVGTAMALFGVPAEEVTREQRGQGKTVNFAVIYGQSEFALARNLRIERDEAKRYIEAFFARYDGVKRFMDEVIENAKKDGGVRTVMGRYRALPDLRSKNFRLRSAAERIARNTPIQGTAADIIKVAMINVQRALTEGGFAAKMLLTVHDELVFEVPKDEEATVEALVRTHMEGAAELSVPLLVEAGWGDNWGQAH